MIPDTFRPSLANLLSIGAGLFIGAIVAPIVYLGISDWWEFRQITLLESSRILDPRWRVVDRTESSMSIHSWGVRYRSPECRFLGIEAMAISPERALRPTTISRPGGIGPRGTLPSGKYDAGVWTVDLPPGYVGAMGIGRYECRKGGLVVQARAVMFHVPPEVNDAPTKEQ